MDDGMMKPAPMLETIPPHIPPGLRRIHYDSLLGKPDLSALGISSSTLTAPSSSLSLGANRSMIALRRFSVAQGLTLAIGHNSIVRIGV
jgi:hypothetical protein